MAKIQCEYDTKTKELSVKQDGETVPNVHSISISKDSGYGTPYGEPNEVSKYGMDIHAIDTSSRQAEGYHTHTHISASANGELVKTQETKEAGTSKALAGFIGNIISAYRRVE